MKKNYKSAEIKELSENELIELLINKITFTKSNFKYTFHRLRKCAICKYRFDPDKAKCASCPPMELLNQHDILCDVIFMLIKLYKQNKQEELFI